MCVSMNDFSVFDNLGHVAKHSCQLFVSTLLINAMLSLDMRFFRGTLIGPGWMWIWMRGHVCAEITWRNWLETVLHRYDWTWMVGHYRWKQLIHIVNDSDTNVKYKKKYNVIKSSRCSAAYIWIFVWNRKSDIARQILRTRAADLDIRCSRVILHHTRLCCFCRFIGNILTDMAPQCW